MAVQRGRSERMGESYSVPYGELQSDARTKLADFFSILLAQPLPLAPLAARNPLPLFSCTPIRQTQSGSGRHDASGAIRTTSVGCSWLWPELVANLRQWFVVEVGNIV